MLERSSLSLMVDYHFGNHQQNDVMYLAIATPELVWCNPPATLDRRIGSRWSGNIRHDILLLMCFAQNAPSGIFLARFYQQIRSVLAERVRTQIRNFGCTECVEKYFPLHSRRTDCSLFLLKLFKNIQCNKRAPNKLNHCPL